MNEFRNAAPEAEAPNAPASETIKELQSRQRRLQDRVEALTQELTTTQAQFDAVLRSTRVHCFSQDRDLRYTWSRHPMGARDGGELLIPEEMDAVAALKRRVLETGRSETLEVPLTTAEGEVVVALHLDPVFGPDGAVSGLMGAVVDVTRTRSLETVQRKLTEELAATLQRYQAALRGSAVTVFTHDLELRYTSISNGVFGREPQDILGRTDEEMLPIEQRGPIIALKREALEAGHAVDGEVHVEHGGAAHWYDLHIEPLRDPARDVVGVTCAAVDITERKNDEGHLRFLLRELTHRSKNLLAVIQAIGRQTARHARSTEGFLDQFGARLDALAKSHDLLIQEGWHGASMRELVHAQLGQHAAPSDRRVCVTGPPVLLAPEAAQYLGLALHELAANAAQFGALSEPGGRLAVSWTKRAGEGVEFVWSESGGPPVLTPKQRGFGSLMIERNLVRSLEADVDWTFEADGVRCRLKIPAHHLRNG